MQNKQPAARRGREVIKCIYLISGVALLPDRGSRVATAKRLNAEIIFINTPREECIKRAMFDEERGDKEKQIRIIDEYFVKLS